MIRFYSLICDLKHLQYIRYYMKDNNIHNYIPNLNKYHFLLIVEL